MNIPIGVEVSTGYNSSNVATTDPAQMVWYKLSDHNRQPIGISYELIENTQRMANGQLRKYVVARKFKITTDWKDFPTIDTDLVDYSKGAHAAAWIKAFYEANAFYPIYIKLIFAADTIPSAIPYIPDSTTYKDSRNSSGQVYNAFMTSFTYDVVKRRGYNKTINQNTGYDYVNLKIEFTEI
jgi:hypothetical protein